MLDHFELWLLTFDSADGSVLWLLMQRVGILSKLIDMFKYNSSTLVGYSKPRGLDGELSDLFSLPER